MSGSANLSSLSISTAACDSCLIAASQNVVICGVQSLCANGTGLIYRMKEPKVVLLIFVSGKVVLTGAESRESHI